MTSYESAKLALDELDTMMIDEPNFDASRILMIDRDTNFDDLLDPANEQNHAYLPSRDDFERIRELTKIIFDCDSDMIRERITDMTLAQSLCPLHIIDYAICFDDDDPACATIRMIHPNHDT